MFFAYCPGVIVEYIVVTYTICHDGHVGCVEVWRCEDERRARLMNGGEQSGSE